MAVPVFSAADVPVAPATPLGTTDDEVDVIDLDGGYGVSPPLGGERSRAPPTMTGSPGLGAGRVSGRPCGRVSAGHRGRSCSVEELPDGTSGHAAATIASNSARSSSSSAQSTARKSSSRVVAAGVGWDCAVSVIVITSTVIAVAAVAALAVGGQALTACRSPPSLSIMIFRGLAFSATGMRRVRTPAW